MKLTLTPEPTDKHPKGTRKLLLMCLNYIDKNLNMIDGYSETEMGVEIVYGAINGNVSAMDIVSAIKARSKKGWCLTA